jgi:membrane complex biogenesis BtpA family protein
VKEKTIFNIRKPIIGVVHIDALPGTPNYNGDVREIIEHAKEEALIYKKNNIDVIAIENMHDVPYLKRAVGPEITSIMSVIGYEVKNLTNLPCGIQILAGANKEALAAANSAGLDFIRAEGFVFAHIADEGLMESDAGVLLRYRKQIDAESILIFTDVKKKHSSHSITLDVDIVETATSAGFFLSDGVIVTGTSTGKEPDANEVQIVKEAANIPVIIGSGITVNNIEKYFPHADAFIIGSHFKKDGSWKNEVDITRVKSFMEKLNRLRK